jgi:hypothetical protein
MKSLFTLLQAMLVLAIGLGSSLVHARQPAGTTQTANGVAMLPSLPGPALDDLDKPDAAAVQGNVEELKQMVRAGLLTEMRVTYNGSYGASMLFFPRDMAYYIALFQDKNFWRVVKTQDLTRAERSTRTSPARATRSPTANFSRPSCRRKRRCSTG